MATRDSTWSRWFCVKAAAVLHPEILGHRDLHAGDVVPVPHRLEKLVSEPDVLQVQHRLLAEEVVDAQDLVFGEVAAQVGVELARGGQVMAERLLHRDSRPAGEPRFGQGLDDAGEQAGRDLQVVQRVSRAAEGLAQPLVRVGLREVARQVGQAPGQAVEHLLVDLLTGV